MQKTQILVTGGTGFIGSWVVRELLEQGHSVRVLARRPDKVPGMVCHPGIELVSGDLADRASLTAAVQGCGAVVHLALGWGETPTTMLQNDTAATAFLLEAAAAAGAERFLYTSSTAAMGDLRHPMHLGLANRPNDLYGATKAATEAYVLGFAGRLRQQGHPMLCNIIRPGYTFGNPAFAGGPTQPDGRFRNIVRAAAQGQDVCLIRHDGTQFLAGSDIAKVYAAALASDHDRKVWLALASHWTSWETIVQEAFSLLGSARRVVLEDRGWGADPILFDVSGIQEDFGLSFHSERTLTEHLRYLVTDWNTRT